MIYRKTSIINKIYKFSIKTKKPPDPKKSKKHPPSGRLYSGTVEGGRFLTFLDLLLDPGKNRVLSGVSRCDTFCDFLLRIKNHKKRPNQKNQNCAPQ
jgi:hypothetical protein